MEKEFIWNLTVGDEKKIWKCVLLDDEVVTYEDGQECNRLKITNPEVKQGVLQIDAVTSVYGQEVRFQLEKNVPYIKLDDSWSMSQTTFEERKEKFIRTQKIAFISLIAVGIVACLIPLARYLLTGDMGDWWFLIVLGTLMIGTAYVQRYEGRTQLNALESKDE